MILAAYAIVDANAVTAIKFRASAEGPNCLLHEPWKALRKLQVKLARIDFEREQFDGVGASPGPVAIWSVGVRPSPPVDDASPVQPVVNEGIDRDHPHRGFDPQRAVGAGSEQEIG